MVRCPARSVDGSPLPSFRVLLLTLFLLLLCDRAPAGVTPYEAIVSRNAFGLKPPPNPADLIKTPEPVVADIKLQGITTILGRKQVLLKVKQPAAPGQPASDESLMLAEGQRDGDVDVIEINVLQGTVLLKNGGSLLSLNMKENADKPTPGAVPVAPGAVHPPGLARPVIPGVPPPAISTTMTSPGNSGVTTFGGTETRAATPTLPTRTLRTGNGATGLPNTLSGVGNSPTTSQAYQPPGSNLSADEQMAMLELQRAANQGSPTGGLLPPLPARYRQQK
jgi:hypothetical protein